MGFNACLLKRTIKQMATLSNSAASKKPTQSILAMHPKSLPREMALAYLTGAQLTNSHSPFTKVLSCATF